MQILPYLHFDGTCEAAFRFYEHCLSGKIVMMMKYAGSPAEEQTPPDMRDKIMHARLVADGAVIMGSDAPRDHYHKPQGYSASIQVDQPARAEAIFKALSDGAHIIMPLQTTFWAERFGMLSDKFGIPWMVNCEGATAAK